MVNVTPGWRGQCYAGVAWSMLHWGGVVNVTLGWCGQCYAGVAWSVVYLPIFNSVTAYLGNISLLVHTGKCYVNRIVKVET